MRMARLLTLSLLILVFCCSVASADLIVTFNNPFPGDPNPDGTPPWLTAIFSQNGANDVRLTMTANLVNDNFLSQIYFNTDPAAVNPATLGLSFVSGTIANDIVLGEDCCKADGDGTYDIRFDFPTSANENRFDGAETSVWDFTGPGLTPDYFSFLSTPAGGSGPFYAAAHVQSISAPAGSTWIHADLEENLVPEPASLAILGTGLLLLGRKLRRS